VELSRHAAAFVLLRRDEASRELPDPPVALTKRALALPQRGFDLFLIRDVPHDHHDLVVADGRHPCFEMPDLGRVWKRIDHVDRSPRGGHPRERADEFGGDLSRQDVSDVLSEELVRRREQLAAIARVVVDVQAVSRQQKQVVRYGRQHRACRNVAQRSGRSPSADGGRHRGDGERHVRWDAHTWHLSKLLGRVLSARSL